MVEIAEHLIIITVYRSGFVTRVGGIRRKSSSSFYSLSSRPVSPRPHLFPFIVALERVSLLDERQDLRARNMVHARNL
jgi:hypothetical protein